MKVRYFPLLFLIFSLLLTAVPVKADTIYMQRITIENNNTEPLTDYQIKITLTANTVGEHFNWSRGGADVRFYDESGNKLPYWIESWDEVNQTAIVWIKANLSTGDTYSFMYYGNSSAQPESNPESVFEFWDDFNGTDLDFSKWKKVGTLYYSLSNGMLTIWTSSSAVGFIQTLNNFPSRNIVFEAYKKHNSGAEVNHYIHNYDANENIWVNKSWYRAGTKPTDPYRILRYTQSDSSQTVLYSTSLEINIFRLYSVAIDDTNIKFYVDNVLKYSEACRLSELDRLYYSIALYDSGNGTIDWVRVRKYAPIEPVVKEISSEELVPSSEELVPPTSTNTPPSYYMLSLDGIDDYVMINSSSSLDSITTELTIVAVVQDYNTTDLGNIIARGGNSGWRARTQTDPYARTWFLVSNGSTYNLLFGNTQIAERRVYMLAFSVKANGYMKTYMNGQLDASAPYTLDAIGGQGDPVYIGALSPVLEHFKGMIYLVLVYNRTLSDAEIQAIYENPMNPPTNGLVLWLSPDSVDPTAGVWADKSGNGNDGTIYGATPVQQSLVKVYDYNTEQDISVNSTIKDLDDNVTLLSSLALIDYGVPKTLEVRANGYIPIVGTVSGGKTTYAFYLRPVQTPVITQNELNSQNAVGIGINFGFKLLYYGVGAMILFGVFGIAGEEAQRKMAIILAGALGLVFFIYMLLMV